MPIWFAIWIRIGHLRRGRQQSICLQWRRVRSGFEGRCEDCSTVGEGYRTTSICTGRVTYSNLYRVLVANQTDFRGPGVTCDDSSDENEALVVGCVGSGYMCAIGRPAGKSLKFKNEQDREKCAPEAPEESASRRVLEWLSDLGFKPPVGRSPDLHGAVVGL